MPAKKHRTLMMSKFFVMGGIEFIAIEQKLCNLRAKIRKIDIGRGKNSLYIRFFN